MSIPRVSKKRRARSGQPGKLGIVRLYGADMKHLRWSCYTRDNGICQACGVMTGYEPRFDGDPIAYYMAHIKSRGAGGSDVIENVRCLCHRDHMKEHTEGRR